MSGLEPIRGSVHRMADWPKEPEEMTLRDAIEWTKSTVRQAPDDITIAERRYIDEAWLTLLRAVSEREGIGPGALGYFIDMVARLEIQLIDTAKVEGRAALTYQGPRGE